MRAGQGRLVTICDIDSPPAYPVMVQMNFRKEAVAPIMVSLNWATADEEYTPSEWHGVLAVPCAYADPVVASSEPPSGKFKSDGQRTRLNKRKVASDTLMQNREELFNGEFDGYAAKLLHFCCALTVPQSHCGQRIRSILHYRKTISLPCGIGVYRRAQSTRASRVNSSKSTTRPPRLPGAYGY